VGRGCGRGRGRQVAPSRRRRESRDSRVTAEIAEREIEVAANTVQIERVGTGEGGGGRRGGGGLSTGTRARNPPAHRPYHRRSLNTLSQSFTVDSADVAFLLSVKRTPSAGPPTVTPKHCTYVRVQILPTDRPGKFVVSCECTVPGTRERIPRSLCPQSVAMNSAGKRHRLYFSWYFGNPCPASVKGRYAWGRSSARSV